MIRLLLGFFLSFVLLQSPAIGETIYEWTDEQGKTHYSNSPPMRATKARKNEMESGSETRTEQGGGYSSSSISSSDTHTKRKGSSTKTTRTKKKSSSRDDMNAMCKEAVHQGLDTIKTYLATMKKNMTGGYISKAEYKKGSRTFLQMKKHMSVRDCLQSTGQEKKFYKCLARTYGDVLNCGP